MDDQTKNLINNEINNNEVCLFMKGTPDAPQCGFSMAVTNILKILEVNFKGVNVLADQNQREGIKAVSYTHLRAHETGCYLVCRLLLEKNLFLMIRRPPRSTL